MALMHLLVSMRPVLPAHTSTANNTDTPYKSPMSLVPPLLPVFSFVFLSHECLFHERYAIYHLLWWFPYHHPHQNFQVNNPGIVYRMIDKQFLLRHLRTILWIYRQDTRMIMTCDVAGSEISTSLLSISFNFWEVSTVQGIDDRFLSFFEDENERSRRPRAQKSDKEKVRKKTLLKLYESCRQQKWILCKYGKYSLERGTFLTGLDSSAVGLNIPHKYPPLLRYLKRIIIF